MSVYSDIKSLIEERPQKKAIKAIFHSEANPRELWPHVLGKNAGGFEIVLCYQGVGPDPTEPSVGYRCFKTDDLTLVGSPFIPTWSPLKKFKYKDVIRQNCVIIEEVDVFR